MEIEKKYLVRRLPDHVEQYPHDEIEQAYLCQHPTLRIRRKGGKYFFTYKNRPKDTPTDTCVAEEVETAIDFDTYMHLYEKADGDPIHKTRYRIPYEGHTIELDLFHGSREGMMLAEVEFASVEESKRFIPPDWFGENVSGDVRYSNAWMALHSEN